MYVNTSAFKLRSFKELQHFSPRIVERVWGWFGGVSVGRSGWRSVGGSELKEGLGVGESGTL